MAPRWPKMAPSWPQDGPKMAQDGPKTAQDDPKMAPRGAQDGEDGYDRSFMMKDKGLRTKMCKNLRKTIGF